jgi:hypothetical protein
MSSLPRNQSRWLQVFLGVQAEAGGTFLEAVNGGGLPLQLLVEPVAQRARSGGRVGENQRSQHRGRPAPQPFQAAAEHLSDFGSRQLLVVENIGDAGQDDALRVVAPGGGRRALDEFRQLKTGESAGEMDSLQKLFRGASATMGEGRQAVGIKTVGCVQEKDSFAAQQRPGQKVMRQARALRMPVHHYQPATPGKPPQQAAGLRGETRQRDRGRWRERHSHLELVSYFRPLLIGEEKAKVKRLATTYRLGTSRCRNSARRRPAAVQTVVETKPA